MAEKSYTQILKELEQKKYSPVYFLCGDEAYFIDLIADYIEKNLLDESEKSFNQSIFYGKDSEIANIINSCNRFPMMAEKQLVIIREAQELPDIEKQIEITRGGKKVSINLLEEYVKNPTPTTVLVICFKYKKLDGRKSLGKTMLAHSEYLFSQKIKDNQVAEWIKNFFAERNQAIQDKAAALMANHLGTDLSKIINETNKLIVAKNSSSAITENDIYEFVGISKEYNVFEFMDSILTKNAYKAFEIAKYFGSHQKENPFPQTIALMFSNFSNLITYHNLPDKSSKSAMTVLKVPYFVFEKIASASKLYPYEKCATIIHLLRVYDLKYKGVDAYNANAADLLLELVYQVML
jgi:DNA polymerase III subunit delta